jgi:hypothetical protein
MIPDIGRKTDFYDKPWSSFSEAKERVLAFKNYIENQDGYLLLHRDGGSKPSNEKEVQRMCPPR